MRVPTPRNHAARHLLCVLLLGIAGLAPAAAQPGGAVYREPPPIADRPLPPDLEDRPVLLCGREGFACCRPPAGSPAASQSNIAQCNAGLGCNVATDRCERPCGGTGQVCCDGPDTEAPRWNDEGRLESPTNPLLKPMCETGRCDVASHRCADCGGAVDAACCAPDARQATAFCVGDRLWCRHEPNDLTRGVCRPCGARGQKPCGNGRCDGDLGILFDLCAACGRQDQAPCDGRSCFPPFGFTSEGLCGLCGAEGQIPCERGCNAGLRRDGSVCRLCGATGQPPCSTGCDVDPGVRFGLCAACGRFDQPACDDGCYEGVYAEGVCVACGRPGFRACLAGPNGGCDYMSENVAGVCSNCGTVGSSPCSQTGCLSGGVAGGVCSISCGNAGSPPCDGGGCAPGTTLVAGVCQYQP